MNTTLRLLFALLFAIIASVNANWNGTLSVRLFPYIPNYDKPYGDFEDLVAYINARFAELGHDFNLDVQYTDSFDSYTPSTAAEQMGSIDGVHVAEIDLIDLKEIQDYGVLAPAPQSTIDCCNNPDTCDWFDMSCTAGTLADTVYGTPTWMCSNFAHTVEGVNPCTFGRPSTVQELVDKLQQCQDDAPLPFQYPFLAPLTGSWTTGTAYFQAYADTFGYELAFADVFNNPSSVNATALEGLKAIAQLCQQQDGSNPCINKEDKFPESVNDITVDHETFLTLAYHEVRNTFIALSGGDASHFKEIFHPPLGNGHNSVFFQDALVISKACSDDNKCRQAAEIVIDFLSGDLLNNIAFGDDAVQDYPRYLLPSKASFFEKNDDAIYKSFYEWFSTSPHKTFPNGGFYGIREEMQAAVLNAITPGNEQEYAHAEL